jgi:pyruvate formate-lyase activating enzyme-like uncharacterized protein
MKAWIVSLMGNGMPRGCDICLEGAKMVIFVTGLCDRSCFYCPLSEKRRGLDVVYADEVPVEDDLDIILEGRAIDAEGSGITGGDPLMRLGRTIKYIRLLKKTFGRGHHIHLYTNGRHAGVDALTKLKEAGLDEIRFHPSKDNWGRIKLAKNLGMYAGAEIPAIPGGEGEVKEFVKYLVEAGADFLNINKLEFCPQNALQMKQKGFSLDTKTIAAVKGSEEVAIAIVKWAGSEGIELPIHYCSSAVKDALQIKRRLMRRAVNAARPYEEILGDGLLGKFIVRLEEGDPKAVKCELERELSLAPHLIGVYRKERALVVPRQEVERVRILLPGCKVAYVQEYPTYTRESFAEYPC